MTKPHPYFERQGFTPKQIQNARRYVAKVFMAWTEKVESGKGHYADHVTLSRIEELHAKTRESCRAILRGDSDGNFTVWQRMNFVLTGESVPFLAKETP